MCGSLQFHYTYLCLVLQCCAQQTACVMLTLYIDMHRLRRIDDPRRVSAAQQLGLLSTEKAETLVLYAYSNSDLEYERNLHYFVEHGMAEGDGCDYIIVVQEVSQ